MYSCMYQYTESSVVIIHLLAWQKLCVCEKLVLCYSQDIMKDCLQIK